MWAPYQGTRMFHIPRDPAGGGDMRRSDWLGLALWVTLVACVLFVIINVLS